MDGWMDGWMDGYVLVFVKPVGCPQNLKFGSHKHVTDKLFLTSSAYTLICTHTHTHT